MACTASAQRIVVHAPSRVTAGETFRLEYTINTNDVDGRLQLGNIPDAFEVVYGPSVSQQQSYSMGRTTITNVAKECKALHKVNGIKLIDSYQFDRYIESHRVG